MPRVIVLSLSFLAATVAFGQKPPELPKSVSLVPEFQKFGLAARAQGSRDTCSLFAVTAAANFELARENPKAVRRLSEEFLTWAANDATGRVGDQAMFYEAIGGLNALGICSDDQMTYEAKGDPKRRPTAAAIKDAKELAGRWNARWIKRWDLTQPLTDAQFTEIKRVLAAGHPVACGLRWPRKGGDTVNVPAAADVFDGHSILFVGYEDDAKKPGGGLLTFRNSSGPNWGNAGYGTMSYAYARAYANDAFWLELGSPGSEIPTMRFEAETLPVTSSEKATAGPQDMAGFGGPMWSGGKQLFARAELGGFIELTFTVKDTGKYRVRALGTAAPDFATIRATLDGKPMEGEFDLYSGRVCPAGSLELGTHSLAAGKHTLRFIVMGKNPGSKGLAFGIDAIDIIAVK